MRWLLTIRGRGKRRHGVPAFDKRHPLFSARSVWLGGRTPRRRVRQVGRRVLASRGRRSELATEGSGYFCPTEKLRGVSSTALFASSSGTQRTSSPEGGPYRKQTLGGWSRGIARPLLACRQAVKEYRGGARRRAPSLCVRTRKEAGPWRTVTAIPEAQLQVKRLSQACSGTPC